VDGKRWCGDCKKEVVSLGRTFGTVKVYFCRECEKYWFVGKQIVFSLNKEQLNEANKNAN